MTSSSEKDKNISNPFMGNTTAQIHLFLAMRHNKPIGVYRHFNMFGIFKEFCDSFRPKEGDFTPKHIWTFLDTMYDMDGLHSTETKPRYLECVRDYTLPTEDSFYRRRMDEIVKELRQTPADDEKKEECSPKRAAKEPWKNASSENATQGTVGIRPMSSRTGASSSAQTQNPSTPKREYSIRISTSADTPGAGSSQSSRRHSTRGTSAKDPGEPSPSADRERRDSSSSSEIGGASTARSTPVRTTPGGIRVRKESDKDSDSSSAPTSTRSNSKRTRSQLSQGGGGVSSPKDNLSPATKRLRRHL